MSARRLGHAPANAAVRMIDTRTGNVPLMAADERAAFQDEIDRLQTSVKAMDERVTKLENSLSARLESKLPSEEDFNKTMSYMERFLKGFMGIVKDMDKDNGAQLNSQKT